MEEDYEEKTLDSYCSRSKSYPSLPANYVSILDLKERWLKQKQVRDNPVQEEPAQARHVEEKEPELLEKSGEQVDEAKEKVKAKKKWRKKKKQPKLGEYIKEVERKFEEMLVSEKTYEDKTKGEIVTIRVYRKKNVGGGRELEGSSVKEGAIVGADKDKNFAVRVSGENGNFDCHNGGRFGGRRNERLGGNRMFRGRMDGDFGGNGRMENNMIWVKKGEPATSTSNGNVL